MTQFTKNAALLVITVVVIAGCKKNDNSAPSKTQLLTTGSWTRTSDYIDPAVDVNGDGVDDHEIFNFYDDCDKDDMLIFKSDGTVTFDAGPLKCDPTDPQTQSTTWKFLTNESQLMIGTGSSQETVDLVELSATALKYKITYNVQGTTYTETVTCKH